MAGILTAGGQLERCSEYRFDVFCTDYEHLYVTVKQGRRQYVGRWAIAAGESSDSRFFDKVEEVWSFEIRGADAYCWDLEPALLKAQELAFTANQEYIDILEDKFPGEFRGGPYDMTGKKASDG